MGPLRSPPVHSRRLHRPLVRQGPRRAVRPERWLRAEGVEPGQPYALECPASALRGTSAASGRPAAPVSPSRARRTRYRRPAASSLRLCAASFTPTKAAFSCHNFADAIPSVGLPCSWYGVLFLARGYALGCVVGSPSSLLEFVTFQVSGTGTPHHCRCSWCRCWTLSARNTSTPPPLRSVRHAIGMQVYLHVAAWATRLRCASAPLREVP